MSHFYLFQFYPLFFSLFSQLLGFLRSLNARCHFSSIIDQKVNSESIYFRTISESIRHLIPRPFTILVYTPQRLYIDYGHLKCIFRTYFLYD